MDHPSALLAQARELCVLDPRRPKQVNLRRAISSAYYALFHRLISDATGQAIGFGGANAIAMQHAVGRWFNHGTMVGVAGVFARPATAKGPVRALLVDDSVRPAASRVPTDLADVAHAFETLQEERHRADYDLGQWYARTSVTALVDRASGAFDAISRLRGTPEYGLFLTLLLTGEDVAKRR